MSYRWLRELLDLPAELGPREVGDKLTLLGVECEAVEDLSAPIRDVVVGAILSRDKHPNADTLSLCTVDVGGPEPLSIVCGAPNCDAGKLTAVARPGVSLKGGPPLEKRAIRGVESHGMLCSGKELGLAGGDHDGILIVEGQHAPGTPLAKALGLDDFVLVLSVTPNRPDVLSHVGVARDLAAFLSMPAPPPIAPLAAHLEIPTESGRRPPLVNTTPPLRMKAPSATCAERGGPVDDAAQVKVDDLVRCPRYLARVIEGVTVGPSPQWVQRRLEACGVRSINNVVDVTNLILLERGHPLHAFDLDKLGLDRGRATIVVRTAKPGEKMVTLDGVERQLHAEDLLICDPERPLALAGVMGGKDSEVHQGTTRVLLEAAYFAPAGIRRTARRHALHTEASHRFERGCDPNKTLEEALNRCAQLIAELAGGQVRRGVAASYPKPIPEVEVKLRPARAAMLLGLPQKLVDEALVARALSALGLEVAGREAGALRFKVPTFRPDLTQEVDLIEEIGRLLGLDRVPETLPRGTGRPPPSRPSDTVVVSQDRVRATLLGAGFHEAVNMGFISPREADPFDGGGQRIPRLVLRNPISEELSIMRPSLLPGLLRSLAYNQRHGEREVRLFELGTAFLGTRPEGVKARPDTEDGPTGGDAYAKERTYVGIVASGTRMPRASDTAAVPVDFYDLKGVVEEVVEALGFNTNLWDGNVRLEPVPADRAPYLHPGMAAGVKISDEFVGVFGELHPALQEKLDLRPPVLVAELDVTALAALFPPPPSYKPVPRFPAVKRDVAVLVDERTRVEDVYGAVRRTPAAAQGVVEKVELFDVYRGKNLPAGKKSLALSLTFRAADRTLTDEAVNALHAEVMATMERDLKAEVRKG
ncbi:MAG: phenylalanine--tRNA ligase subunit beta [Myxococcota bacterium]